MPYGAWMYLCGCYGGGFLMEVTIG